MPSGAPKRSVYNNIALRENHRETPGVRRKLYVTADEPSQSRRRVFFFFYANIDDTMEN